MAFGRMGIEHPHFLKLAPKFGRVKFPFPIEIGDFTFFQISFILNLEYTWTFISTFGIFVP
jgi:hypothetical protein